MLLKWVHFNGVGMNSAETGEKCAFLSSSSPFLPNHGEDADTQKLCAFPFKNYYHMIPAL